MTELTERQKFILALVVHEYARTAAPVGSNYLVNQYHLEMSSATIRNELAFLTEQGYLRQPHTSAGRVPTEEGYRYFVSRLLQDTTLPEAVRHTISHQFYQTSQDMAEWMRLAASVLAHQSRAVSLVTAPHMRQMRFKHLELIATRGRQVLMVLVLYGGEVRQRMLTLAEAVSQEQLSGSAHRLNVELADKDLNSLAALRATYQGLDCDVLEWVMEELKGASSSAAGEVYLDGMTNLLSEPEFSGSEDARRPLRLLEERSSLQDLLDSVVLTNTSNSAGVQVLIGGEGNWDELRQCSVLLTRFGAPGLATGTLGVLGPMRLPYGRAISTMRFLSSLLSDLVSETMVDE